MAGTHQKLRKMWAGRRVAAVTQLLLDRPSAFQSARHALRFEPLSNLLGPAPAPFVQLRDRLLQCRCIGGKPIAQYMNGSPVPQARELDAIDQLHTQRLRGSPRLGEAVDGVVVGKRQQLDAAPVGALHQLGGRQHAIGGGAVAMQIDDHQVTHSSEVLAPRKKLSENPARARQSGRTAG